jgi:hypothetical protein
MSLGQIDPALQWIARLSLASLFLWSAAHKVRASADFRAALSAYRLVPTGALRTAHRLLVAMEVAISLALLVPGLAPGSALAAAGLLCLYSAAILVNLVRGRREIDCGCAGLARSRPISPALLSRNAALVAAALLCVLPSSGRAFFWLDAVVVVAGSATALLLFVALETAVGNAIAQRLHVQAVEGR